MAEPQTLREKYYAINTVLNNWLVANGIRSPVYKFGVDPSTIKAATRDQNGSRYPYFQSFLTPTNPTAWTLSAVGTYARFEYQLNFYTSPQSEFVNDAARFNPFFAAKMAFSDIDAKLLVVPTASGQGVTIADVLSVREEYDFGMASGAPVPTAVLLVSMAAIVAAPIITPDPGTSTDVESALELNDEPADES